MNLDSWNWENVWECLSQAIFDLSQCMASTLVRLCFRTFARGQHCQELSVLLVASIFPFLSTKRFSCFVTMEVQVFMSRCVLVTKKHLPSREATPSAECSKTPLSQPSNPPGAPAHFDVGTLDISAAGRTSAARKPGVRQQRWQNSPTKWQFPQIFCMSWDLLCRAHLTTGQVPTRNKSQTSRFIKTHLSRSKMDTSGGH